MAGGLCLRRREWEAGLAGGPAPCTFPLLISSSGDLLARNRSSCPTPITANPRHAQMPATPDLFLLKQVLWGVGTGRVASPPTPPGRKRGWDRTALGAEGRRVTSARRNAGHEHGSAYGGV